MRSAIAGLASVLMLQACAVESETTQQSSQPVETAASSEDAQISDILNRMSLERKVAQLIQPQINSFTAEDMERYRFGSYLNGGNGGPNEDEFAPALEWLALADEMWDASTAPLPGDEPVIPAIWGTDAVHGHTNIVGATIFPHNIGLGATRDADLVRRIGKATAVEIEVTGIDWNFSPTIAVAQDDRWGRTYESYSEDPAIVAELGAALVEGLQGQIGSEDRLGAGRVLSTAKHFFGDGGTEQGVDQGDVNGEIEDLKPTHISPYSAAIDAGVESVMASFNSINGKKMHGNKELLTGVLRDELGFDGLVVGDWNGHGQIAGCTVSDCPESLVAGLDIYMVPDDWEELHDALVAQVQDGTIPMERLDDAVTRVLRMKLRAGILGEGAQRPSERAGAGDLSLLGSPEHRAIAREAVAKSQVVLKNEGVLPLAASGEVLVAGTAANSIAQASGGWTLTWQGGGELTNDYFPGATSIYEGISLAVKNAGGVATLSEDGAYEDTPDVAIVVFGEEPYAEFAGDKRDLVFRSTEGLELLKRFQSENIPTVAVFLSGRPLWMNRELNAADAFIASWLPGGEGAGVADILFGERAPTGRLSFTWPSACEGTPVNSDEGALFPIGFGLNYDAPTDFAKLDESCAALLVGESLDWFSSGRLGEGVTVRVGNIDVPQMRGSTELVAAKGFDRDAQEDARELNFVSGGRMEISGPGESEAFRIVYEVPSEPAGTVEIFSGDSRLNVTPNMNLAAGKGWREMVLTTACLPDMSNTLAFQAGAELTLRIDSITREELEGTSECSF